MVALTTWTPERLALLRDMARTDPVDVIAAALGVTTTAIRVKASTLGLQFDVKRPPGRVAALCPDDPDFASKLRAACDLHLADLRAAHGDAGSPLAGEARR